MKQFIHNHGFQVLIVAIAIFLLLSSHQHAGKSQSAIASQAGHTVIIDPGHGGEDGGATGITGAKESELNLEVSLKLRELLRLFGVEPVMVRQTDTAVYSAGANTISEKKVSDIHNRVKLVNETSNALLVSVHQNFFTDSRYDGAQVFYADNSKSKELAEALQQQFKTVLAPENHREAKPAASSIYLMNHVRCTAVLVECGFLSNAAEEARLQTGAYQTQIAAVIAAGVLQNLEDTNEI